MLLYTALAAGLGFAGVGLVLANLLVVGLIMVFISSLLFMTAGVVLKRKLKQQEGNHAGNRTRRGR